MKSPLTRLRYLNAVAALGLAAALSFSSPAFAQSSNGLAQTNKNSRSHEANHWVGTWAVSPLTQETIPGFPVPTVPTFNDQTLRQIVHTSIGGSRVRVRFSNLLGAGDLVIGSAHLGLRGSEAQVVAGSDRVLTFGGRLSVTIPPGALMVSDPVNFEVPERGDLAISMFLPNATAGTTLHSEGKQTNYFLNGDQTGAANPTVASTALSYYFLTNVEIRASSQVGAIVCLGDSITDGTNSTPDTNRRYPNFLARRLLSRNGNAFEVGVLDQGIAGNRLLHTIVGPNALSRFDRDVIAQPGVTDVILLEGINDIGFPAFIPTELVSAEDIIAAYRQLIARAHEAGLRIYGGTLTPFVDTIFPGYYTPAGEVKRQAANNFIRNSGEFDGVIDFEAAVRDNSNPPRLRPEFDSGDHLHPNDAGYEAMANAVPLQFFKHNNF